MPRPQADHADPLLGPWPGIEAEMREEARRTRLTAAATLILAALLTALLMFLAARIPASVAEARILADTAGERAEGGHR